MRFCVCVFSCLSGCLGGVCLCSICLQCLSAFLCVNVSVILFICLSVCLFVCQSVCLSVNLSVCQPVCLSVCLSVSQVAIWVAHCDCVGGLGPSLSSSVFEPGPALAAFLCARKRGIVGSRLALRFSVPESTRPATMPWAFISESEASSSAAPWRAALGGKGKGTGTGKGLSSKPWKQQTLSERYQSAISPSKKNTRVEWLCSACHATNFMDKLACRMCSGKKGWLLVPKAPPQAALL